MAGALPVQEDGWHILTPGRDILKSFRPCPDGLSSEHANPHQEHETEAVSFKLPPHPKEATHNFTLPFERVTEKVLSQQSEVPAAEENSR